MTKESSNYVTREELLEKEIQLHKDMMEFHEKNSTKISIVNDKVDDLKDLVLPLVESSRATASNTEKIASSLDVFINKQSDTNGDIYKKLGKHNEILAERKGIVESYSNQGKNRLEEKKMKNTTKGLIITGIVGIITALITIAPALAQVFFK